MLTKNCNNSNANSNIYSTNTGDNTGDKTSKNTSTNSGNDTGKTTIQADTSQVQKALPDDGILPTLDAYYARSIQKHARQAHQPQNQISP